MTQPDPFAAAAAQQQAAAAPAPPPQDEAQQPDQPIHQGSPSPWDNPPPEAARPAAPVAVSAPAADDSEQVRITLKAGSGYDVPWITVDFPSIDVAHEKLTDNARKGKLLEIFQVTAVASSLFQGAVGNAPSQPAKPGGGQAQNGQPAASQQAPNGEKRYCTHGEMPFKSGVSKKNGRPYQMFVCPERNRDAQCDAQFLN